MFGLQLIHSEGNDEISANFKRFYIKTIDKFYNLRNEQYPHNVNWVWHPRTVFTDLAPWTFAEDFGILCNRLISCAMEYMKEPEPKLRSNLIMALNLIDAHLPQPAPKLSLPWSQDVDDWRYFSIVMPEAIMAISIALFNCTNTDETVARILEFYLTKATKSMDWIRYDNDAIRMGVPYIFSKFLRNVPVKEIVEEEEIVYILGILKFPFVESGNGLLADLIPIRDDCVRSVINFLDIYFCLGYYTYFFGVPCVDYEKIITALQKVITDYGITNPALNTRKPSFITKNILGDEKFSNGIFCGDMGKVLTMRSTKSFACIVGTSERLAYYEADPRYDTHAPLWAMNKRLHNRSYKVNDYTETSFRFESGIILFDISGIVKVPTVNNETSTFLPKIGKTAIVTVPNILVGAIYSESSFTELHNLKFNSLTILFEDNLIQLYYNIYMDRDVKTDPCVSVLNLFDMSTRFTTSEKWFSNSFEHNGIIALHMNIENIDPFPEFRYTIHNTIDKTLNQPIDRDACFRGEGICCFRQIIADAHIDPVLAKYDSKTGKFSFRLMENERIHISCGGQYLGIFDAQTKHLSVAHFDQGTIFNHNDLLPALQDLDLELCVCEENKHD